MNQERKHWLKENGLQVLTLVLCVLLLGLVLRQQSTIDALRSDLESKLNQTEQRLENAMDQASRQVAREIEEAGQIVEDYTFVPTGIDVEKRALLAEVTVTLKQWRADSAPVLSGTLGGEPLEIPMTAKGGGVFAAPLAVPTEDWDELLLTLTVDQGGTLTRQDLGGWGELDMLLPLRASGSSWSGPDYRDGRMECEIDVVLEKAGETEILDPTFRVYCNETLAQEVEGEISKDLTDSDSRASVYAPALPDQTLQTPCSPGDAMSVTFFCRDSYGLGYEFPVMNWTAEAVSDNQTSGGTSAGGGTSGGPILTWPE